MQRCDLRIVEFFSRILLQCVTNESHMGKATTPALYSNSLDQADLAPIQCASVLYFIQPTKVIAANEKMLLHFGTSFRNNT
jgi:hypothetical protein